MADGVPFDDVEDSLEDISLPLLQASLGSNEEDVRIEAVTQISAFVSESYGEEGAELGMALRESGIVAQLAALVSDESAEVRAHTLLALGNLCSDSVDPASVLTKALLLELGMETALLANVQTSAEPSVLLVACATLQNLCHDAAWAKRVVAAGVEARLESLVSHSDPRVVRYASGALKNLTIASATLGAAAPQLSAHANQAVRERERQATLEQFSRRRADRLISRRTRDIEAPVRLRRVLRTPYEHRDAAWLESLSMLHALVEEEAHLLEFALGRAAAGERAEVEEELVPIRAVLKAADHAVLQAVGDLPVEEEEVPPDTPPRATLPAAAGSAGGASGAGASGAGASGAGVSGAGGATAGLAGSGSTGWQSASGGIRTYGGTHEGSDAEEVEEEEEDVRGGRPSVPSSPAKAGDSSTSVAAAATEEAVEEVPEEVLEEGDAPSGAPPKAAKSGGGVSSSSGGGSRGGGNGPAIIPEANRLAAEQWLQRARERHDNGDDEAALKHCERSLKLCETAAAQSLATHIRKFGAGSAPALAVAKVLGANDHWEVLQVGQAASEAEVKKAYKKLSLVLHPDRNHASGAEGAFKRLSESYSAVTQLMAAGGAQTPMSTPRANGTSTPSGHAPATASPAPPGTPFQHATPGGGMDGTPGSVSGDATPRAGPPRRRRQWEKVLGLGKKRSVERD